MERSERAGRRPAAWIAVAIGALALAWWLWPGDSQPSLPNDAGARSDDASARRTTATLDGNAPAPTRTDAGAATSEGREAPATSLHEYSVTFTARDAFNLPVDMAAEFGPEDGAVLAYAEPAGVDCDRTYRWSAAAPRGTLVVGNGLLRRVVLHAGRPVRVASGTRLEPPTPDSVHLLRGITAGAYRNFGPRLAPFVSFVNASSQIREIEVESRWGMASEHNGVLRGVVLAPNGEPARDCAVRVGNRWGTSQAVARDGTFECKPHPVGAWNVMAGSSDGSTAQTEVLLTEGSVSVILQLVASPTVCGRVVTPAGEPVANARLVWTSAAGDHDDRAATRQDGSFVMPVRSAAAGMLWACVPGVDARWPAASCGAQTDVPAEVVVDPSACRGSLRFSTPILEGFAPQTVAARLWQRASGLGMRVLCTNADEKGCTFAAGDLPPGQYHLELLAPAFGVFDAGSFWCDGQRAVDLGRVELPPLCDVTVDFPAGAMEPSWFELVRLAVFPSRLHTDLGVRATHRLAAGDYELWFRYGITEPRSVPFTVAAGVRTLKVQLR